MIQAVFPGSFDPITNGHLDILQRASRVVDKVYLAIGENAIKNHLLTTIERKTLITEVVLQNRLHNVEVISFQGLLVDFLRELKVHIIIRGLRAVSDYEHELQLAHVNRVLSPNTETMLMVSSNENSFISSSIVREVAKYGGDVSRMVPHNVAQYLHTKYQTMQKNLFETQ